MCGSDHVRCLYEHHRLGLKKAPHRVGDFFIVVTHPEWVSIVILKQPSAYLARVNNSMLIHQTQTCFSAIGHLPLGSAVISVCDNRPADLRLAQRRPERTHLGSVEE